MKKTIFTSWNQLYVLILLVLFIEIVVFYLLTLYFSNE